MLETASQSKTGLGQFSDIKGKITFLLIKSENEDNASIFLVEKSEVVKIQLVYIQPTLTEAKYLQ